MSGSRKIRILRLPDEHERVLSFYDSAGYGPTTGRSTTRPQVVWPCASGRSSYSPVTAWPNG